MKLKMNRVYVKNSISAKSEIEIVEIMRELIEDYMDNTI